MTQKQQSCVNPKTYQHQIVCKVELYHMVERSSMGVQSLSYQSTNILQRESALFHELSDSALVPETSMQDFISLGTFIRVAGA